MPRFFTQDIAGDTARITGADAAHIARVLRMCPGEGLTVCDMAGTDAACEIVSVSPAEVLLRVCARTPTASEPSVHVTLYQCLPKADKMDLIVQKSVELGVRRIVPVLSERCVSRPDAQALSRKRERLQKIAFEAAKQSGRGLLPEVMPAVSLPQAVGKLAEMERGVLFYEKGGDAHRGVWEGAGEIGICIGPEGGFADGEVALARTRGVRVCTLGPRILRTETAPLCVLSIIMYATGNL